MRKKIHDVKLQRASSADLNPNVQYQLIVRQQPEVARAYAPGEKVRHTVDPPPVVELEAFVSKHSLIDVEELALPCLLLQASILGKDYTASAECLIGSVTAKPAVAYDEHNKKGAYFVFSDLSCQKAGRFTLEFSLVKINCIDPSASLPLLASVSSDIFQVYSSVDFPGTERSTPLTQALRGQGLAVPREEPTTQQRGRPKTLVVSACWKCKKDHLSCDIGRPCARCIQAGHQDRCYDVPPRKRGRPKLDQRVEPELSVSGDSRRKRSPIYFEMIPSGKNAPPTNLYERPTHPDNSLESDKTANTVITRSDRKSVNTLSDIGPTPDASKLFRRRITKETSIHEIHGSDTEIDNEHPAPRLSTTRNKAMTLVLRIAIFAGFSTILGWLKVSESYIDINWRCRCGKSFRWKLSRSFADQVSISHSSRTHTASSPGNLTPPTTKGERSSTSPSTSNTGTQLQNESRSPRNPDNGSRNQLQANDCKPVQDNSEYDKQRWVIALIRQKSAQKAVHIPVQQFDSDENLIKTLKTWYVAERNQWDRFIGLKAVRSIQFVHFKLTKIEMGYVKQMGVWPPPNKCNIWKYTPCPQPIDDDGKLEPLVGADWMLHMWHYPDHGIPINDASRDETSDTFLRDLHNTTQPYERTDQENRSAKESDYLLQHFIFSATPKKAGAQLWKCKLSEPLPPDGWGLFIEEGPHVSWYFIAALVIYILASLTFAAVWAAKYDTAESLNPFDIATWMLGLLTLVVSCWFAAMKD